MRRSTVSKVSVCCPHHNLTMAEQADQPLAGCYSRSESEAYLNLRTLLEKSFSALYCTNRVMPNYRSWRRWKSTIRQRDKMYLDDVKEIAT